MKKNVSFWGAFFAALGAMFVLSPRATKVRDKVKAEYSSLNMCPDEDTANISSYFDKTGEYLFYGIEKVSKAKI